MENKCFNSCENDLTRFNNLRLMSVIGENGKLSEALVKKIQEQLNSLAKMMNSRECTDNHAEMIRAMQEKNIKDMQD